MPASDTNYPVPSTFDRADGKDGREGIATPTGVVLINDNGTLSDLTDDPVIKLRELCTSPEIERAEQGTITHAFILDWTEGVTRLTQLGRGTLMVSEDGDVSRVLSSSIRRERGGYCTLTVTAESISFDTPPDEFSCTPTELGIHIIKHPRYFSALNPASSDSENTVTVNDAVVSLADIKQSIIRAIQAYMDAPIYPSEYNINGYFQTNVLSQVAGDTIDVPYINPNFAPGRKEDQPIKWDGDIAAFSDPDFASVNCRYYIVSVPSTAPGILLAKAAAREIIEKIWRQEEQPYVIGYEMKWISYWFRPPPLHPGGVLDDPIFGGREEIPDYFISTEWPPNRGYTIFDWLPVDNPQCYSLSGKMVTGRGLYASNYDISWLRKADDIDYQRTWFKLTRTWLGAPLGTWDPQLYYFGNRPSRPDDYVTQFPSLTV